MGVAIFLPGLSATTCQPFKIESRNRQPAIARRLLARVAGAAALVETQNCAIGQDGQIAVRTVSNLERFIHRPGLTIVSAEFDRQVPAIPAAPFLTPAALHWQLCPRVQLSSRSSQSSPRATCGAL